MSLTKNSLWNIAGYIIPSLIAIPSLGFLSRNLGMEQFGLFTLAYAVVGYATIFDLGLTRAVVFSVSVNREKPTEVANIIGTSLYTLLTLSIICGSIIYISSEQICKILNTSPSATPIATISFKILAFTIPPLFANFIFSAFLEGTERFSILNIQKSITSTIIALGPILGYIVGKNLYSAIAGLTVSRTLSAIISYHTYRKYNSLSTLKFRPATLKNLVQFGGWITISNIISPIMTYFDRFILSNIVGSKIVAHYTAPSDLISRLAIIPGSITSALFPKLSFSAHNNENKINIKKITISMILVLTILVLPTFIAAPELMQTWMGNGYEGAPSTVLRILLIGFTFNSLANIPYTIIQANNKSKLTALTHAIEVIPYLALLFFLIKKYLVIGAAIAWTIRVTVDCIMLSFISIKIISKENNLK